MIARILRTLVALALGVTCAIATAQSITTTPSPVVPNQRFVVTVSSYYPLCAVWLRPDNVEVKVVDFRIEITANFTCVFGVASYALQSYTVEIPPLAQDEYFLTTSYGVRYAVTDPYQLPQLDAGAFIEVGNVPQVARMERVSGDRQIIVGSQDPNEPFVVRVVDLAGRPVRGAALSIGPTGQGEPPSLRDAFGFRGFNTPSEYASLGYPLNSYGAVSDVNGLAGTRARFGEPGPSAQPAGAVLMRRGTAEPVYFSEVLVTRKPAGTPKVIVEYYNAALDHYFDSLDDAEIALLDAGRFTGWKRSIGAFVGYATRADAPPDAVPVCRFFSAKFTSHFYTANPDECDEVVARYDDDTWLLETREAFYIQMPDRTTGACKDGLQPVYRMYSNRPIPNHRYITDRVLRDRMTGAGWRAEGYGPEAVAMCTAG